jgi:regulator of extracellular matrix RemA (YlzA/DUF370 family)
MTKHNQKYAAECTKLANAKFGLEMLCERLLSDINCCDNTIKRIIKHAKNREFKECCELIEEVKKSDAYFVSIQHVTSAMRPKASDENNRND